MQLKNHKKITIPPKMLQLMIKAVESSRYNLVYEEIRPIKKLHTQNQEIFHIPQSLNYATLFKIS